MFNEIYNILIANLQLIIGWFLGLLSAVIGDRIKRFFQKKDVKRGIISEIKQIQLLTIGFCISTTLESKLLTTDWSKWIKPFYERFLYSDEFEYHMDESMSIKARQLLTNKSDEEFHKHLLAMLAIKQNKKHKSNLTIAKLNTPFLNSNFSSISLFKGEFQSLLYKFNREIDLINSDAEQIWYYHTKTFDKITDLNHDVVVNNIDEIIVRVARRSMALIKLCQIIIDY